MTNAKILLVEDNPNDEKLTIRALQHHNIANDVIIARDGVEALDYIFARGKFEERDPEDLPQVVLLDLKLPKMDGLEVLQALRKEPRTKVLPVVVLTSSNEESDIVSSYNFGANSYIRKPVDFKQFISAIEQLGMYWLVLNQSPTSH